MSALEPHLPILQVIVPLIGALAIAFLRRGNIAWIVAAAVTFVLPVISVAMAWKVLTTGQTIYYEIGNWAAPYGIVYKVDALSAYILCVISVIGAVTIPFARKSVATEIDSHLHAWYYTMYLICLAGLLGITITGDAFNAFVFLEISSLATYVLIALGKHRRALLASYQYLIMGTIGATLYVIGVGLLYVITGTLNFEDMASRLGGALDAGFAPALAALGFVTVGISLKLALFPLHVWLPNAYAFAPSFATAFLAGTATKVAIYLLVRLVFFVFGAVFTFESMPVSHVLLVLSIVAMFVASISAVFENNAKRMLAYSSVAQVGYITLGIGLANVAGMTGALVHILNHAVMKTALFLALGAVFYRIGSVQLSDMAGIGRKMPLTMLAFGIAGLGLIGTPGTAGFISKWFLALGALDKHWWWLVLLIVLSSLIALVYIGRITEIIWFRKPSEKAAEARDPPFSMLVPLFVLAAATVYLGFDTRVSASVAGQVARQLFGGIQ